MPIVVKSTTVNKLQQGQKEGDERQCGEQYKDKTRSLLYSEGKSV
jgi:hypothetical protein